ncbi:nitrogenase stabilizing/protective protein NifW [Ideonella sp. B7]|uniref:nitrogenase stabilizing/protective protein NifW n=1 Tax=Ideonella benzenivorans TaxID=2831643 RepID=UPI001CED4A65|nr:nitrogenase stabilizing/protective protein NifW [Ideonella benzenivorans]MCA6218594.1 nitrogenase stabilizing/protective protein NifW [Ideonella benzenivorans]
MNDFITQLKALSSANEFLDFFGIAYDEHVVNVNRLHILKRFYQYLHKAEGLGGLDELAMFQRYRELLVHAYQDFVQSDAATEKVFKVFQDAGGQQHVSLSKLRDSLAERREGAPAATPPANLRAA